MGRLFKEVFKSLARNKVTLICLTILIFLTSGIFTLFFDIKTSYTNTINSYDKISRLHDLSVDLDVNSSGLAPNGGFDQIDDKNKSSKTASKFKWTTADNSVDFSLTFPQGSEKFIQLKANMFGASTPNFSHPDYYIKAQDFMDFFLKSKKTGSGIEFEINKYDALSNIKESQNVTFDHAKKFSLSGNHEYKFDLYKKEGNSFIPLTNKITATKDDTFNLDKEMSLNDITRISYTGDGKGEYAINPISMYLNVKTKEATFDISKYNEWKSKGLAYVLSGDDVLKALGFEKQNDQWKYKATNQANADLKLQSPTSTDNDIKGTDKLSSTFKLKNYLQDKDLSVDEYITETVFKSTGTKTDYELPKEWIRRHRKIGSYNWNRYVMNWNEVDNEKDSNWKGSYFKFIRYLKDELPDVYNELKYFSVWTKTIEHKYLFGNQDNNQEKTESETTKINYGKDEHKHQFENPWSGTPLSQLVDRNWQNINYSNIDDIEKAIDKKYKEALDDPTKIDFKNYIEAKLKKLTDTNEFKSKQNTIHDGTLEYARKVIIEELIKEVGRENLGIRQTMTVETVNESDSSKNVFHFINTGDEQTRIRGLIQNVGKMQNEHFRKTILSSSISNKNTDDFILKPTDPNLIKKIPSVYTKEIIKAIFDNYTPDPNYFTPDIRFESYYDFYEKTQIPRLMANKKLLALTTAETENTSRGASLVGAIALASKDKYIFLKKGKLDEYSNNEVWMKALIANAKDYMTLDELYDYLVANNYTIRGEIGKNGWAWVNPQYKNAYSLPVAFGAINSQITNDIIQNKTIRTLLNAAKEVILESDLGKVLSSDDVELIADAAISAIEKNDYHTLLATSKSNSNLLLKVLFDLLNNVLENVNGRAANNYKYLNIGGNLFMQNVFTKIINYFKDKYESSISNDGIQIANTKLASEFKKILGLFNIDFNIIPGLNIGFAKLFDYLKENGVSQIFDVLKELINALDFEKFSNSIQDWYKQHPYRNFGATNVEYWVLSRDRIIANFIKSIDDYKFKTALKSFISLVDFNKILNPHLESSLFKKWEKNTKQSQQEINDMKSFFERLSTKKAINNSTTDNYYNNINEGLTELFNIIDVNKFASALESSIRHIKHPVQANGKVYENFNTEALNDIEYLASFISSITQGDNTNINGKVYALQDAIIKILNLSNEVEHSAIFDKLKLNMPKKSDSKISIFDILNLTKFDLFSNLNSSPNQNKVDESTINPFDLSKIKNILAKVESAIENNKKVSLTEMELKFLKDNVMVQEDELSTLSKIKEKLQNYITLVSKLYQSKTDGYNLDDDINVQTYGDLAFKSMQFDKNTTIQNKALLETLHSTIGNLLKNTLKLMSGNDARFANNAMNLFSIWIKLAYEFSNIGETTTYTRKNLETGVNEQITEIKRDLTLAQISNILQGLLELTQKDEIASLMKNYEKVINKIPGIGILGSDNQYNSKTLSLAYAHAETSLAAKLLENAIKNGSEFTNFFTNLKNNGIKDKTIENIKNLLLKHKTEFTYSLGYVASQSGNIEGTIPTNYLSVIKEFVKSFLPSENANKLQPLANSYYDLELLYKLALDSSKTSEILSVLNVSRALLNPLLMMSFPQVFASYLLSNNPNEGNIAYAIKQLFGNLNNLSTREIQELITPLFDKFVPSRKILSEQSDANIRLDMSYFSYIVNRKFKDKDDKDFILWDINITQALKKLLARIIEPISIYNYISYTDAGAYLAKVNYGYLSKNKKEVYQGDVSKYLSSPIEMERFIKSLPDKYKVKINSIEYLIIGEETTVDYLYPVTNEENLQVDTKNQALLYVNQKGFDRMRSAYPTFALKEYVLTKAPSQKGKFGKTIYEKGKSPTELRDKFNKFVSSITGSNTKKAYLNNETDPINPERMIRVITVRKIVDTIRNATIYLITLLIVLIAFIVYFIIKRYIEARNKVIGILRAQGYKTTEIALSFCAFGWIPTGVGCLFGYIVGLLLQKPTMNIFSSYWTLQNVAIPFHWFTMLITIIIPLIAVSALIFIITQISVKRKAIELMSGLVEVSIGNVSQKISSIFRRATIKFKYILAMAINNFWKLISLMLAFSTTSLISMFFMSSNNTFNKSISQTYQHRNYRYKLDLESPTTEGGPYIPYNRNDIERYLYVPNDLAGGSSTTSGSQLDYANPNFLRPGYSFNTDVIQRRYDPTVLTKSSLDILMDLSVELSPWDITYANMPETQRARIAEIFKRVLSKMEATQNIFTSNANNTGPDGKICVIDPKKYLADKKAGKLEDLTNRKSYFAHMSGNGIDSSDDAKNKKFKFVEWDPNLQQYLRPIDVTTAKYRQEYRNFLVNAYKKIDLLDFFVSFAGVYWNENSNEKYTYASTKINGKNHRFYGYDVESRFIRAYNAYGEDLTKKLANYNWSENEPIPLLINQVVAKQFNLGEGSELSAEMLNHVDRFAWRSLNLDESHKPKTKYTFKVIGISNTYINNEFITRKDILDKILGYDTLSKRLQDARKEELQALLLKNPKNAAQITKAFNKKYEAFNGILSNDKTPVQTIDTLTTYSSLGYWGAMSSYDVDNEPDSSIWDFFRRIFVSDPSQKFVSVYEHIVNSYNEAHNTNLDYKETLKKLMNVDDAKLEYYRTTPLNPNPSDLKVAREILTKFFGSEQSSIYGKNIMYGSSFNVDSKDIEAGFISGISSTANTVLTWFIIISFIIAIIILVVITNIMITSNQRSIATFSVLGYTNSERVFLFFFNFVPIILMACVLMIPVTYGLIALFNHFMLATSQTVLPLSLSISSIILSAAVCLGIFTITSIATWKALNKEKPIDILKGK